MRATVGISTKLYNEKTHGDTIGAWCAGSKLRVLS